MKKTNYLFMTLVMSILLISCGGKNEKKEGDTAEMTSSESDVPLDQLQNENYSTTLNNFADEGRFQDFMIKDIKRKGEKDNFTGIGVEKDQNDSILNRAEIKNGWLIRYTHRIKAKDRYITIYDLTYDGGKIKDGFVNKYNKKIGMSPYSCVEEQLKYKNGNQEMTNTIKLFIQKVWLNVEYDEGGTIVGGEEVSGLTIIYPNTIKLNKSLTGFRKLTKDDFSGGGYDDDKSNYIYIDADNQIILNTLKNLKNEVKGFDYYEN